MHQISHTHSMYRNTYFYILFVFFEINSISFILLLLINDDVIIVWSGKNIHITLLWCTKNILSPYQLIWLHNCIIIISGHLWFKRISFFPLPDSDRSDHCAIVLYDICIAGNFFWPSIIRLGITRCMAIFRYDCLLQNTAILIFSIIWFGHSIYR